MLSRKLIYGLHMLEEDEITIDCRSLSKVKTKYKCAGKSLDVLLIEGERYIIFGQALAIVVVIDFFQEEH